MVKHQTVNVTEFKAKCLALLEGIGQHGGTITITKRGKPVATVGPPKDQPVWKSPEGILAGKVKLIDDMPDLTHLYDCLREAAEPLPQPKRKARR